MKIVLYVGVTMVIVHCSEYTSQEDILSDDRGNSESNLLNLKGVKLQISIATS